MKLEFKTVKEFLSFLTQDDFSFVEHYDVSEYDYVCFEVETDSITIYVYNSKKELWDIIGKIYGTFFEDGGSINLSCENFWELSLSFTITDETLSVGSIYKIKNPQPVRIPKEKPEKFIEL